MLSAPIDRRRRALASSTILSLIVHALALSVLFAILTPAIVPQGSRETVSQITIASIERAQPKPSPVRHAKRQPVVAPPAPAPAPLPHELSKEMPHAAPESSRPQTTLKSRLEHDQEGFEREVAALNKGDDPHAIPTIDPATQGSTMKTYAFQAPASMRGDEHGNGLITPTRSWHDRGLDCYYGRYEFTYPDGAQESGSIAWPFCYEPGADPFKEPPHPMPFPPPPVGYVLPPGTDLPPIEKDFYEHWLAGNT
jgi:hypothetical protein